MYTYVVVKADEVVVVVVECQKEKKMPGVWSSVLTNLDPGRLFIS